MKNEKRYIKNYVMKKLDSIKYGYYINRFEICFQLKGNEEKYRMKSINNTLKQKRGICFDKVEVTRFLLNTKGIMCDSYLIISNNHNSDCHSFIVAHDCIGKHIWIEHSWAKLRGVYIYDTVEDALRAVKNYFENKYTIRESIIYLYPIFPENMNFVDFIGYCREKCKTIF